MNPRYAMALVLSVSLLGAVMGAAAQDRNPGTADNSAAAQESPPLKPTNLKVLPKDISEADINELMYRYEQALGVQCGFCHAENSQTHKIDYASDENSVKETARIMIGMTGDINQKYLAQLGDRRYAVPITCGNCHQGQTDPPVFEPKQQ